MATGQNQQPYRAVYSRTGPEIRACRRLPQHQELGAHDVSGVQATFGAWIAVIASEDCSANPDTIVRLNALYQMARVASKEFKGRIERLHELNAVVLLCRSLKSREIDHLGGCILQRKKRGEKLSIPP